ncbi:YadA-like family protein [Aggregatibacter actinomycetemcomitans]|nr:YadA-like family protein [Aggregatibacter actinomycetemcomitans]
MNQANGTNATKYGKDSAADGENSAAFGHKAKATAKGATAVGQNATATAENSVALGNDSVADRANTVSVGSEGRERVITNVGRAVKDTDATNFGQVKDMVSASESRLNNKIDKSNRKLRAGIAGATAIASIPQVTQPGAHMVAVGVGNHHGQSAVAVGYSKASDNNKVILKLNAGASTQGEYNLGAGIGYQWK